MEILAKFVKALDDKHADDIVVLDMKNHSPIYDYMIITTAKNDRLAQGIIRELKDLEGISELSLPQKLVQNIIQKSYGQMFLALIWKGC